MLAIIHALNKWSQFLLGSKFSIHRDHNCLQFLLQQKTLSTKKHKWMEKLSMFNMEILHKRGKDNVVFDTLPQKYEDTTTCVALVVVINGLDGTQIEYSNDIDSHTIIKIVD